MEDIVSVIFKKYSRGKLKAIINQIFQDLLNELKIFLNLEVIHSNINIIYTNDNFNIELNRRNVLDLGVKRFFKNNTHFIKIYNYYKRFLPFILMREAYYCFIPDNLKENEGIKIIINQIVEIDLQKSELINEWKTLIREYIIDYDYLSAEFSGLEKFLRLKGVNSEDHPIKLFYNYIRKNVLIINEETWNLYDNIFKKFILKTSKSLYNDEMIETIRVLIKMFYKVRSYKALLDYQNYFKEFIQNEEIQTNLSLRKFSNNLKWINMFSYIAPSYLTNWTIINTGVFLCKLTFSPHLEKKKIDIIMEELPFFWGSKSSETYFSVEISGWFIIPLSYKKDLYYFLNKLHDIGYIVKKTCVFIERAENFLNLNYFREFYRSNRIINPKHMKYDGNYELDFNFEFKSDNETVKLSILDSLIITKAWYWSPDGFSFERRSETTRRIKTDLFNEILSQGRLIKNLKKTIEDFQNNLLLKTEFIDLLTKNQNHSFFYVKNFLKNLLTSLNILKKFLNKNSNIKTAYQFQEHAKKYGISQIIDDNILLDFKEINRLIYRDFLPLYLKDPNLFNEELKKYRLFTKIFEYSNKLKIFDLKALIKIIEDNTIVESIYTVKQKKLDKIYQNYKIQNITSNTIDDIIESFSNREIPIIKPLLINTINTTNFAKYFIEIILYDNQNSRNILNKIKKYFPRVINDSGIDIFTNKALRVVQIYLPNIIEREKKTLVSILYNLLNENIISLKRYFFDGFFKSFMLRDFYDLDRQEFFYTKDLFEQYYIYIQKIFKNTLTTFKESDTINQKTFWSSKKKFNNLVEKVEDRVTRQQISFNNKNLNELSEFHQNVDFNLLDLERFKELKKKEFFKNYVKSIKFNPKFHKFGIGKYYLYFRPINMNEIDLKLLLINNFKKVKYPAFIDNIQSLFITYFFPYRNPNMSYVNWLTKSKKNVSEYCIFFVKKFYPILNFNYNLSSHGWDLDPKSFKTYIQKIIFNSEFKIQIQSIKGKNIGNKEISHFIGANSESFLNLLEITGWKSTDLKSILGTKNYSLIDKILNLIKNDMIISYIKLKNLDFLEKIYIILPNVKTETNDLIIKIFNFFNYGYIYEIEGEFFIHGFHEEIRFENGLMIKLYLPLSELSEFQRTFDKLFQFLKINKYLILNDMVDGTTLIKNIYGNVNFLDSYNPLKNLKWNNKDKIWMNHKLFTEKFEPIYPDLIPKE